METSGNLPMGAANDSRAPYNEPLPPMATRGFSVNVEYVIQKDNVQVETDDFKEVYDPEYMGTVAITEDTDWGEAYKKEHYTIIGLLALLELYIKKDLEAHKDSDKQHIDRLKRALADCQGWELYEEKYE